MNALSKIGRTGFSLIEILISIVILTILVGLAVPGFRIMLQNTQIRNAAESTLVGLQRARAEAVKQNRNIEFVIGWTDIPCAGLTLVSNDCSRWEVQWVGGGGNAASAVAPITAVTTNKGSRNVLRQVTPAGSRTITFDSTGSRLLNNDAAAAGGTSPIASITFTSTVLAPADSHDLTVNIGIGGAARMCDPNIPVTIPRNPRAC